MKTPRLLTLLAAALLCAVSPHSSPAAEVVVDISSFAPRDPSAVMRQIELNVAIKQYEKVLMEIHEARLQNEIGPAETGLTVELKKEWQDRVEKKLSYLEETSARLRAGITELVKEANAMAQAIEKEKAKESAKPKADRSQATTQNPG